MSQDWKPDLKKLGLRLSAARKLKGYNQTILARKVGLAQTTYSAYERGKVEPSLTTLFALAHELDASIAWLLGLPEGDGKGPI